MRKKNAFTLIELLVVISIIALLLAIMIPALASAKELATGIICQSNVSGLLKAWILYYSENDDNIVTGSNYYETGTHGGIDADRLDFRWVEYPLLPSAPDYFAAPRPDPIGSWKSPKFYRADGVNEMTLEARWKGIRAGRLWTYTENVKLYHCPGDRKWIDGSSINDKRYRSYSISGMMRSEDWRREGQNVNFPGVTKQRHVVLKMSEIANPGGKFVFVEEDANQEYNKGGWVMFAGGCGECWWDRLGAYHIEGSILGFADGHSEKIKWKDQGTVDKTLGVPGTDNHQPGNVDMQYMARGYFPGR